MGGGAMSPEPIQRRVANPASLQIAAAQFQDHEQYIHRVVWSPADGLRKDLPLSRVKPSESPEIINLRIKDSIYSARPAFTRVGDALANPILAAAVFVTSENVEYLYALTTRGVHELVGNSWVALTGPALTAEQYSHYALTAWNDKMIYANGYDKIGEINHVGRTYGPIAAAPRARHVTTFAGRLIAGYVDSNPTRIQWSVRNDNTNWTGLGSGYEDLLSTPGGVVDAVRGIFPISDLDAVVVRTRSVWLMRQTGNFDAPFTFNKLSDISGTISPWSLVITPVGLMGLFRDNVYRLSTDSLPEPVGDAVRTEILSTLGVDHASAAYDVWNGDYCLVVPQDTQTHVWRYNVESRKWTKDRLPYRVWRIHSAIYRTAIAMQDLPGTMESLSGPFELLGLTNQKYGIVGATGLANQTLVREDPAGLVDQMPSVGQPDQGVYIELWSGQLGITDSIHNIHLTELLVEYTASQLIELLMDYSMDGGLTWVLASRVTVPSSNRPTIARLVSNLSRGGMLLRLRANSAVGFNLIAAYPRAAEGGLIAY
jgi:hypothetical protein